MRVLQYEDDQGQGNYSSEYSDWESVISRNMRMDQISENRKVVQDRKMAKTKQI